MADQALFLSSNGLVFLKMLITQDNPVLLLLFHAAWVLQQYLLYIAARFEKAPQKDVSSYILYMRTTQMNRPLADLR